MSQYSDPLNAILAALGLFFPEKFGESGEIARNLNQFRDDAAFNQPLAARRTGVNE
jgi:hypothetical protein